MVCGMLYVRLTLIATKVALQKNHAMGQQRSSSDPDLCRSIRESRVFLANSQSLANPRMLILQHSTVRIDLD